MLNGRATSSFSGISPYGQTDLEVKLQSMVSRIEYLEHEKDRQNFTNSSNFTNSIQHNPRFSEASQNFNSSNSIQHNPRFSEVSQLCLPAASSPVFVDGDAESIYSTYKVIGDSSNYRGDSSGNKGRCSSNVQINKSSLHHSKADSHNPEIENQRQSAGSTPWDDVNQRLNDMADTVHRVVCRSSQQTPHGIQLPTNHSTGNTSEDRRSYHTSDVRPTNRTSDVRRTHHSSDVRPTNHTSDVRRTYHSSDTATSAVLKLWESSMKLPESYYDRPEGVTSKTIRPHGSPSGRDENGLVPRGASRHTSPVGAPGVGRPRTAISATSSDTSYRLGTHGVQSRCRAPPINCGKFARGRANNQSGADICWAMTRDETGQSPTRHDKLLSLDLLESNSVLDVHHSHFNYTSQLQNGPIVTFSMEMTGISANEILRQQDKLITDLCLLCEIDDHKRLTVLEVAPKSSNSTVITCCLTSDAYSKVSGAIEIEKLKTELSSSRGVKLPNLSKVCGSPHEAPRGPGGGSDKPVKSTVNLKRLLHANIFGLSSASHKWLTRTSQVVKRDD